MRRAMWAILVLAGMVAAPAPATAASEGGRVLTVQKAVELALARDALVRNAKQALAEARAGLVRASAYTPTLSVGSQSSATTTTGLDPESAVSGTDYSSQSYYSVLRVPMPGGTSVGLSTSASTSTTNSALRTGEAMTFTYAGARVGADITHPIPLLRDESVLSDGQRWSAEVSLRGAGLALEEARRGVVGDTLSTFFAALRAQRQGEIARASAGEADELLRIAQEKLERGKLAEIEVMEARVSADSARVTLRKAESAAATGLEALKSFLGIDLEEEMQLGPVETGEGARVSLGEEGLVERALRQRADLQELALGIRSAELLVRQAEARSRPGVLLTGGYSRSGEAATISDSFGSLVSPSWYVGIMASTSLTRREDRAEIASARGGLELARLERELRQEEVRLEVRRLVREARDAAGNAELLAETLKVAEENLHIRQVQFEHGLVRPIDVTQTEHQLAEARQQHADAVVDEQLAAARLRLAVGEMPYALAGLDSTDSDTEQEGG